MRQLEISLQIRLYAALGLALGDDRVTLRDAPSQRNLRTSLAVLLANFDQDRVIHQLAHALARIVDLVLVAKGRVLRDVDALLLVEVRERVLLQVRM